MVPTNKKLTQGQTVIKKAPHIDKQVRLRAHIKIVDKQILEYASDLSYLYKLKRNLEKELKGTLS